jgi:hypothetical protein
MQHLGTVEQKEAIAAVMNRFEIEPVLHFNMVVTKITDRE